MESKCLWSITVIFSQVLFSSDQGLRRLIGYEIWKKDDYYCFLDKTFLKLCPIFVGLGLIHLLMYLFFPKVGSLLGQHLSPTLFRPFVNKETFARFGYFRFWGFFRKIYIMGLDKFSHNEQKGQLTDFYNMLARKYLLG